MKGLFTLRGGVPFNHNWCADMNMSERFTSQTMKNDSLESVTNYAQTQNGPKCEDYFILVNVIMVSNVPKNQPTLKCCNLSYSYVQTCSQMFN